MAQDNLIYDGSAATLGMDGETEPSFLGENFVSKAVNRTFRGFTNQTRPKQVEVSLSFVDVDGAEDPEGEEIFRTGNVQGAFPYAKTSRLHDAGILISVAGNIFFGRVSADQIIMTRIWTGLDPFVLHNWYVQGEEQVYIQNGVDRPINWAGTGMAREVPDTEGKMPIGTIMAYSHGRIAVSDSRNLIAVSDHLYGGGFSDRTNMENFTENTTYVGGFFGAPSVIGEITGMQTMPVSGEPLAQGELVIFGSNGAAALDLRPPRDQWQDTRLIMSGAGAVSPRSVVAVNNDLWYRRYDGIGSFKHSVSDETREWTDTPLSREVNNWLRWDAPHLLQFSSSTYFDNRLFVTVAPSRVASDIDLGDHRFFGGTVVLDLDKGSTVNPDSGFGWDGLWTGTRPCEILTTLAEGLERMFIVSHDRDSVNRIYEQTKIAGLDNGTKPIESFFVTRKFSDFGGKSSVFNFKELKTGHLRAVSLGTGDVSAQYRNNHYPCWQDWLPGTKVGCDPCQTKDEDFDICNFIAAQNHYRDIYFPDPYSKDDCELASDSRTTWGSQFQLKVDVSGAVAIPWLRVGAQVREAEELASCAQDNPQDSSCELINCCPEDDYAYMIVEPSDDEG